MPSDTQIVTLQNSPSQKLNLAARRSILQHPEWYPSPQRFHVIHYNDKWHFGCTPKFLHIQYYESYIGVLASAATWGRQTKNSFHHWSFIYQFTVMPMGLVNAPPTFQHLMQLVLHGLSWKTCLVYLGDIIVYSKSFADHIQHLREVIQSLRATNLKLKRKWPTPENPTIVRAFLGLCSYYRRFIRCFAQMSQPLHALTQKGKLFAWTSVEQEVFDSLRHALTTAPILSYPDFSRRFLLFTEASNTAIGCVFSQINAARKESVFAYGSHILTPTEKRWSTYDRELWAIVWSSHFR